MTLRPYQRKTLDDLWKWFGFHDGNPCISLPTGSGKSHIIAGICKEAIEMAPHARILMLTHVRELIKQNAEKLRGHWPNAPLGIYSAGLGIKDIDQITFAGIQSVRNKDLGIVNLVVVDEAHLISHKDEGTYRQVINRLKEVNPRMKVIGLTASPYRMGHGLITDDPAIFDEILEPVTIEELQEQGYLARLKSKVTHRKLSVDGVHKRGGEYIESELQKAIDTSDNNVQVVDEVLAHAGDRKHWLFFCTGVEHAEHVRDILIRRGITADTVTGKTPKAQRDRIIDEFKAGQIQALTSVGVLTTGFDFPDIDLIVMMRPTMSPGLYVQMAGRGLRVKSNGGDCLVLDFAGVVEQHGPITQVVTPRKPGEGIAPAKICPECDEIVHASLKVCECGYVFPENAPAPLTLHDDDIQGDGSKTMKVTSWKWEVRQSKKSGIDMVVVTYNGVLSDHPISEYILLKHDGFAGYKALETLRAIARDSGGDYMAAQTLEELCGIMEFSRVPTEIAYKMEGKYPRVIRRIFGERIIFDDTDIIF